ncbi:pyruvate, phosphate dikinase [Nocardioides sp. Root140]|uniref:pyruvate, phosphate dikinase n=1 Tax=Nocardioides sp. Root140 TaxID=1736460 RepID=UPI0006F4DD16|nr:pyruvate, phosphate dikinase [Nocardioides sp. Root140]KQY50877.1 phosphate kinase [Nocardioides sp. Root140]
MPKIFAFDHDHGRAPAELAGLLGGKGAGLAEMSSALGLAVPPGFTISVPVCRDYASGGWPSDLDAEIDDHLRHLGERMRRNFGDQGDPLLLAVRSGAPVSMPGMMDTVLNLGLNSETVVGLAAKARDERFAWDTYNRFLTMYATTVMGVAPDELEPPLRTDRVEELKAQNERLKERILELAGRPVPEDPTVQLKEAVEAVFRSWDSDRARAFRAKEGIDGDLGTAVNVQAMVFGNRGEDSGTGVVFSRNPSTGENCPYGDFLLRAQGEDVVAGIRKTMPIAEMAVHQPAAAEELFEVLRRLEAHYADVCDVEFTVEDGRLWLLQTRIGKRCPTAAVRIAVEMVSDPHILLSRSDALLRVSPAVRAAAREELAAASGNAVDDEHLLGHGLGASPGFVSGKVVLNPLDALDAEEDVILVRRDTSPEDVAGMAASVGILTTTGGLVSHAAVVARGWSIPAVVGVADLVLGQDEFTSASGLRVRAGDVITIDGTSGKVWKGHHSAPDPNEEAPARHFPELAQLEEWAAHEESATVTP